jgi:hypothetical protein
MSPVRARFALRCAACGGQRRWPATASFDAHAIGFCTECFDRSKSAGAREELGGES